MGSCYSCRSNGGLPTYTTVAMATTATADLDGSSSNNSSVAGRGGGGGKGRSLRGGGSFGFRKRTPVSVKSQSKDRTSELVHLYETKISNLCNTNNSRHSTPSSSPIILGSKDRGLNNGCSLSSATQPTFKSSSVTNMSSHFGFGAGTGSMTGGRNNFGYGVGCVGVGVVGGNVVSDANCNDIVNDAIKLGALSNRERFFLSGNLNMTSPTKSDCDFGRENKLVGVGPPLKVAVARADDVQNGNISGGGGERGEELNSGVVTFESIPSKLESNTQLPYMVKTQISGLPRPQIPVIVDKKVSRVTEAMQISADEIVVVPGDDDNHVFEADSGLGNSLSLSERKNEGDTETLAEVEPIEGDTASISSKGNRRESPEKSKIETDTENFAEQHLKATKPSGIARFKYNTNTVSVPTKITVPQQQQTQKVYLPDKKLVLVDKIPKETIPMQTQAKLGARKVPLAVQLSNRVQPSGVKPVVKKGFEARKSTKMYAATNGKKGGENEKWETLAELRQKENITPEVVEVVPLNLPYTAKSDNVAKISCVYKSPRIESVLPSTIIETIEKKRSSMAVEDSDFSRHHHQELGPYSPPSEKDFFLIDDEIADQPALIACQQLPLSSFDLRESMMCRSSSKLATVFSDMNEEGGLPALAHVQSSPVIRSPCQRRRTSRSVDTLSPCSSIDSDDLMMDFERLDESCQSRPLSEVFGDGFQLNSADGKSKEQYLFAKLTAGLMKTPTSAASTTTAAGCDSGSRRSSLSQKTNWILGNSSSKVVSEANTGLTHMLPTTTVESGPANHSTASVYVSTTNGRRVSDDTDATLDVATYRLLTQDITNVKTLLLRLKRVLQEADTANPVLKNGLIPHQSGGETSGGGKLSDERNLVIVLEQENADLRRQVVFLQQQLEERDRSIRLLKQQQIPTSMGGVEMVANDKKDVAVSNAACQTERQRSALNSFLTSVNDESSFGSTVSFRIGKF